MLTVVVLVSNLPWLVLTSFMLGVAPGYITVWATWRVLSIILPRWIYVKGDDFLFSSYHRHILFCFEKLAGIKVILYFERGSSADMVHGENSIVILNHQSSADWVIASSVAIRHGSLGRLRYILKDGLRFLPFYGFYLRMHGSVFINKTGHFDKEKAERQLSRYARDKRPMWLVIFPEGTRFNPELTACIEGQKKFTQKKGLTPLDFVLYPKVKALHVSLEQLRNNVDSLYDITMAYSNTFDFNEHQRKPAPTVSEFLAGNSRKVHVHVKRIPIAEVPKETTEFKQWLYNRFYQKERLLNYFYSASSKQEAAFPGEQKIESLRMTSLLPSVIFWGGSFVLVNCFKETRDLYWRTGLGMATVGLLWMSLH